MSYRYQQARDYVYGQYAKIYNTAIHEMAFNHTNSVDNMITLLAISRSLPLDLCRIAALFHDYAQYSDNCTHRDHAHLSSLYAHQYLTSKRDFSIDEIDAICTAISTHSRKDQVDEPIAEALKDADVMARFLEDPEKPLSPTRQKRMLAGFADIRN